MKLKELCLDYKRRLTLEGKVVSAKTVSCPVIFRSEKYKKTAKTGFQPVLKTRSEILEEVGMLVPPKANAYLCSGFNLFDPDKSNIYFSVVYYRLK